MILFRNHPNNEPCEKCPTCISLPCIIKLSKIANHPSLLQVELSQKEPNEAVDFASHALRAHETMNSLGGVVRKTDIITINSSIEHSGKMIVLDKLLVKFSSKLDKTLLFSQSTKMLTIIEEYIKSRGWRYCRLDGQTMSTHRQKLVDNFNKDPGIFVFLFQLSLGDLDLI